MTGQPYDPEQVFGAAPSIAPTPAGPIAVYLPDRVSGQTWMTVVRYLQGEHAPGDPTSLQLAAGVACRCGQAAEDALMVRSRPSRKVLCVTCRNRPLPVREGDKVAFRLADSDLFRFVHGVEQVRAHQIRLTGVVELEMPYAQDVAVRVDGWPIPHTVDVDRLVERPARLEDMARFWPDKTPEQLAAAYQQITAAGHQISMVYGPDNDEDEQR